jgi:hypothetical protein
MVPRPPKQADNRELGRTEQARLSPAHIGTRSDICYVPVRLLCAYQDLCDVRPTGILKSLSNQHSSEDLAIVFPAGLLQHQVFFCRLDVAVDINGT